MDIIEGAKEHHQATLAELTAEFDRRLAALQAPDTHEWMDAVMASRGRVLPRPKAGASF